MKRIILFLLLSASAATAFAQFPLGGTEKKIRAYFDQNVAYSSAVNFRTANGSRALCFTKVRVLGDYTFFFNNAGICTSYVITYDKREMDDYVKKLDVTYSRVQQRKWADDDNSFEVSVTTPKPGENFFSVIYQPSVPGNSAENAMVSNY